MIRALGVIRALGPGDEGALEAFLARHADSSMFLRADLRRFGLVPGGGPNGLVHLAAWAGARIVGVVARAANGNTIVQAPADAAALGRALASARGPATGLVGPAAQVAAIRPALEPRDRRMQKDSIEVLLALDLDRLVVPAALAAGRVAARPAVRADLDLLAAWRHDYAVEANGAIAGAALAARARVEAAARLDTTWLALVGGAPVACQSFNAVLPDMVQVGGVWTPPALRGRRYAQAVIAAALRAARARGVRRAVLFTGETNLPAQRAYRAIGFTPVGDYALVQYGEPPSPTPSSPPRRASR